MMETGSGRAIGARQPPAERPTPIADGAVIPGPGPERMNSPLENREVRLRGLC
jgi:hypothetical protein